jgi:hypothetical protein
MAEFNLTLTDEERAELLRLLTQSLNQTRVEVHRTDALSYKAMLEKEESVLERLLEKVRALSSRAAPV